MGLFDALTTAVSGLQAQSFAMQNISGNIANSQTTAYKGIETSFEDLIPGNSVPTRQIAGGVIANSRATNNVQGTIQSTTSTTDMAVNGNGFFVVQAPTGFNGNQPLFGGIDSYTRRGDFQLDANGYLVNGAGYFLEGIPIDPTTGNPVGSVATSFAIPGQLLAGERDDFGELRDKPSIQSRRRTHLFQRLQTPNCLIPPISPRAMIPPLPEPASLSGATFRLS